VRDLIRPLKRSCGRQLEIKKKEAVSPLSGRKLVGSLLPNTPSASAKSRKNQYTNERLANESAAQRDVTARGLLEPAVEPAKESSQRSARFFARAQQHRGQRRLSVSALKAEMTTETAIVTANCLFKRP